MGWLRNDKDLIGLVLAWAILLQAVIFSFTSGAHAASVASEAASASILCTTNGLHTAGDVPSKKQQAPHWCCTLACRLACGTTHAGGLLPTAERVPLPIFKAIAVPLRLPDAPKANASRSLSAPPRAPPLV